MTQVHVLHEALEQHGADDCAERVDRDALPPEDSGDAPSRSGRLE
jgi:hypothetical protein